MAQDFSSLKIALGLRWFPTMVLWLTGVRKHFNSATKPEQTSLRLVQPQLGFGMKLGPGKPISLVADQFSARACYRFQSSGREF